MPVALAVPHSRRQAHVERGDRDGARRKQACDGTAKTAGRACNQYDLDGAGGRRRPDEGTRGAGRETGIEGVEGTEERDGEGVEEKRAGQSVSDGQGEEDNEKGDDGGEDRVEHDGSKAVDSEHRWRKESARSCAVSAYEYRSSSEVVVALPESVQAVVGQAWSCTPNKMTAYRLAPKLKLTRRPSKTSVRAYLPILKAVHGIYRAREYRTLERELLYVDRAVDS